MSHNDNGAAAQPSPPAHPGTHVRTQNMYGYANLCYHIEIEKSESPGRDSRIVDKKKPRYSMLVVMDKLTTV